MATPVPDCKLLSIPFAGPILPEGSSQEQVRSAAVVGSRALLLAGDRDPTADIMGCDIHLSVGSALDGNLPGHFEVDKCVPMIGDGRPTLSLVFVPTPCS